jgi:hypothetical protein
MALSALNQGETMTIGQKKGVWGILSLMKKLFHALHQYLAWAKRIPAIESFRNSPLSLSLPNQGKTMKTKRKNSAVVHYGPNRADRRMKQHKSKSFEAIEANRKLSKERRQAKNASMKRSNGGQSKRR